MEGGGCGGQGAVCSPILMSTEGNILCFYFLVFSPSFSCRLLLERRSKSLSHKQGISHHALGGVFCGRGKGGLCNCVILQRTCSAVLIEQMICQFVMFIFREASTPCSAQHLFFHPLLLLPPPLRPLLPAPPLPPQPAEHCADVSSAPLPP